MKSQEDYEEGKPDEEGTEEIRIDSNNSLNDIVIEDTIEENNKAQALLNEENTNLSKNLLTDDDTSDDEDTIK